MESAAPCAVSGLLPVWGAWPEYRIVWRLMKYAENIYISIVASQLSFSDGITTACRALLTIRTTQVHDDINTIAVKHYYGLKGRPST